MNPYNVPPRIVQRYALSGEAAYAYGAAARISRNLELQNSLIPTTKEQAHRTHAS